MILWLIIMIFPQIFAGMFTSDSTLLAFTKTALRIYMAVVFIFGIQIACQMTFISLGRAKDSIIVAIVRKFILVIPLIYILPNIFRADRTNAVYMAEPVADILAVTFTAILFSLSLEKPWQKSPTAGSCNPAFDHLPPCSRSYAYQILKHKTALYASLPRCIEGCFIYFRYFISVRLHPEEVSQNREAVKGCK